MPSLQVVLAFFEKRKTQRWSLIGGKQEERLYWEQWCVSSCFSKNGNACTVASVKDMKPCVHQIVSCLLSGHHQCASPVIYFVEEVSACDEFRCINVSIVEPSISQQSSFTLSDGEHTHSPACVEPLHHPIV